MYYPSVYATESGFKNLPPRSVQKLPVVICQFLIQSKFFLKTKHKIIHIHFLFTFFFFFAPNYFMILSSIFLDFLFLPTPLQFSPPHISTQYWPDTIYCSVNCISVFFYFFFWSSNTNCSKFQIGVWYFDNFVFVSIKDVFLLSKPEFPSFLSNRIFKTKPGKKKRKKGLISNRQN